jgi:hypothetical protein
VVGREAAEIEQSRHPDRRVPLFLRSCRGEYRLLIAVELFMFARRQDLAGRFTTGAVGAGLCLLLGAASVQGQVLLDDKWSDGSRAESKRPAEAAVWVGRDADVSVKKESMSTALTPGSQKIWTYFTDKEPVALKVGQTLKASISFIPRGALSESTSRSLRIGLFHDPTNPRVEKDLNNDGGGPDAPWADAKGYAVQVLVAGGEYSSTKPFDLGKRTNLESKTLLGTSGDYTKVSGGQPVALAIDKEYTITFEIDRVSETQTDLIVGYRQGKEELSSWSVTDDGSYLGTEPAYDKFDMLFVRLSNNTTLSDKIDFTNFKVELTKSEGAEEAAK